MEICHRLRLRRHTKGVRQPTMSRRRDTLARRFTRQIVRRTNTGMETHAQCQPVILRLCAHSKEARGLVRLARRRPAYRPRHPRLARQDSTGTATRASVPDQTRVRLLVRQISTGTAMLASEWLQVRVRIHLPRNILRVHPANIGMEAHA